MKHRQTVALFAAMAVAISSSAAVQHSTQANGRLSKTRPDFTGVWLTGMGGSADGLGEPEILPKAEFVPEYQLQYEANKKMAELASTPEGAGAAAANSIVVRRQAECLPFGTPAMMGIQYSIDIIQRPERITMIGEYAREIRRIWLDRELPPLADIDPGWWGYSVGKWEDNVLVVTTIGIRPDIVGEDYMPHSEQMVITERISMKDENILIDDVTIVDPVALKKPWSFTYKLKRAPEKAEPPEDVCENNRYKVGEHGNIISE